MNKALTIATLLAVSATLTLAGAAEAGNNDHFESRRRDAEHRRQASIEGPRTPWGGPTTSRNWWTPVPPGNGDIFVPHRHGPGCGCGIVFVPAHYEWYYGRLILVPARYEVIGTPQNIHIEHRHIIR